MSKFIKRREDLKVGKFYITIFPHLQGQDDIFQVLKVRKEWFDWKKFVWYRDGQQEIRENPQFYTHSLADHGIIPYKGGGHHKSNNTRPLTMKDVNKLPDGPNKTYIKESMMGSKNKIQKRINSLKDAIERNRANVAEHNRVIADSFVLIRKLELELEPKYCCDEMEELFDCADLVLKDGVIIHSPTDETIIFCPKCGQNIESFYDEESK
jgi:hypothetical protein